MWLWYNWRSAIILSSELVVLDEEHWDGWKDIDAVAKRIKILQQGMLTPEASHLASRFDDATILQDGHEDLPSFDWPQPSKEALSCLDQGMMRLGQQQLMETATNPDYRLEHLVNSCDELRETTLIHEARIIEWLSMMYPQAILGRDRVGLIRSLAKSEQVSDLANKWSVNAPDYEEVHKEWKVMKKLAEITNMSYKQLDATEHQIRLVSESYMPSLSLLLGPMLAARMCVAAHSRARLARLPAGTIQILGAEQAFFEHLKHGSAPPKHGHLFMHPWVGKSPRWVRGKIARMLAGKVCLAVRSDHFGGQIWDEKHVQEIKSKVESLIKNHPRPPKR